MPKLVNIKGYGQISFPDSATNDEIKQVLSSFQKASPKETAQAVITPQAARPIAPLPRISGNTFDTDPVNRSLTAMYANMPSPSEALMGVLKMSPMGMAYDAAHGANPVISMLPIDAQALGNELGSGMYADAAGRMGAAALQALLLRKATQSISPKTFSATTNTPASNVFAATEKGLLGDVESQIKAGGAIPAGVQKGMPEIGLPDLQLFHDPQTRSTLALPMNVPITSQMVANKLASSRKGFIPAQPQFNYR